MSRESQVERKIDRYIEQASRPRSAAVVIAIVTTTITVVAALLMTVLDRDHFPTLGSGLWWAVQTVTTVGYGDHVPETAIGQVVAAFVMLVGIGFVTVITASITGAFVERTRREHRNADVASGLTVEQIDDIVARLERIEASLRS